MTWQKSSNIKTICNENAHSLGKVRDHPGFMILFNKVIEYEHLKLTNLDVQVLTEMFLKKNRKGSTGATWPYSDCG